MKWISHASTIEISQRVAPDPDLWQGVMCAYSEYPSSGSCLHLAYYDLLNSTAVPKFVSHMS